MVIKYDKVFIKTLAPRYYINNYRCGYSNLLDRTLVFASDSVYNKQKSNSKVTYQYQQWEKYGYVDYVTYQDYISELVKSGELTEEERSEAASFGRKPENDSEIVKEYVQKFTDKYKSQGYTVQRLNAVMLTPKKVADGGRQQLFAYKDVPLYQRLWNYFTGLVSIDNINKVDGDIGERGLTFTLYDPVYGGDKFSPAIISPPKKSMSRRRKRSLPYCVRWRGRITW